MAERRKHRASGGQDARNERGELRFDVNNATVLSGIIGPTSGGGSATDITIGGTGSLALGGDGTLGGSLSFASGADLIFNASQTLTVNGASVSFGGFGVTDLRGFSAAVPDGTYQLIDGLAAISTTNLANLGAGNAFDLGGGRSAYFEVFSGLSLVVVPEPSVVALTGIGLAIAAAAIRRRSR